MAIIKPEKITQYTHLRTRISRELYKQLEHYCKWAEISHNHFVQEAITYILRKDKEYKASIQKK